MLFLRLSLSSSSLFLSRSRTCSASSATARESHAAERAASTRPRRGGGEPSETAVIGKQKTKKTKLNFFSPSFFLASRRFSPSET